MTTVIDVRPHTVGLRMHRLLEDRVVAGWEREWGSLEVPPVLVAFAVVTLRIKSVCGVACSFLVFSCFAGFQSTRVLGCS